MFVSYRFKDDDSVNGFYAGIFNTDKLITVELTHNDVDLCCGETERYWRIDLVFDGYRDVEVFEGKNIETINKIFEAISKSIYNKTEQHIDNIGIVRVITPNCS